VPGAERTVRNMIEEDACERSSAGTLRLDRLDGSGVSIPKAASYAALFTVLSLIDFRYLQAFLDPSASGPVVLELPEIVKFVFLTAWPFAAIAVADDRWSSKDGARIAVGAFVAPAAFWFSKCGVSCLGSVTVLFFPFVLSAVIGHAIGAWHRPRDLDA
jgi:hypothetical protein